MKNEQIEKTRVFISFRDNYGFGGMIGDRIYNSLRKNSINVYFSSAYDRRFVDNYRASELKALNNCDFFVLILTNDYISKIKRNDEVLFEIQTALKNKTKMIAVADSRFKWKRSYKNKLRRFLSEEDTEKIMYLDYITYFGMAEFPNTTEKRLFDALQINKTTIIQNPSELKKFFISAQQKEIESNNSFIKRRMDYYFKNYYTESKYFVNNKFYSEPIISKLVDICKKYDNFSMMIFGEAGSGKSSTLRMLYFSLLTQNKETNICPVFLNLNGTSMQRTNSYNVVESACENYKIQCDEETIREFLRLYKLVFILDGVDETDNFTNYSHTVEILAENFSDEIVVYSCRRNNYQFLHNLSINFEIELKNWTNEEKNQYIRAICDKEILSSRKKRYLKQIIEKDIRYSNPMMLVFIIIYLEDCNSIEDFSIYNAILFLTSQIINNECKRTKIRINKNLAFDILEHVSWLTLLNRRNRVHISFAKLIDNTSRKFNNVSIEIIRSLVSIFVDENCYTEQYNFAHETFMEFFIAKQFTDKLYSDKKVDNMIEFNFSSETNKFITCIFALKGTKKALEKLESLYDSCGFDDYIHKQQILTHVHRTHEYSMLREFAHERIKKERSVDYLMLLHTAYIAGDSEDENEFYTNIKNDKNFSMLNSGMALVYYNPYLCLEVPYFDDGTVDWYNVFKAFQNHIENINDVPHYKKIVRVNLLTANNFIRTRKKVEPEIASYYISKQQFFETNENSSEFEIKVFEEYKSLMETINRYRKG